VSFYSKLRKKKDSIEVESHPTTLEEVRVPTIVKSLPFSMNKEVLISHIKKIKKQRNNGKMQD
jgi:hypothetical protein